MSIRRNQEKRIIGKKKEIGRVKSTQIVRVKKKKGVIIIEEKKIRASKIEKAKRRGRSKATRRIRGQKASIIGKNGPRIAIKAHSSKSQVYEGNLNEKISTGKTRRKTLSSN